MRLLMWYICFGMLIADRWYSKIVRYKINVRTKKYTFSFAWLRRRRKMIKSLGLFLLTVSFFVKYGSIRCLSLFEFFIILFFWLLWLVFDLESKTIVSSAVESLFTREKCQTKTFFSEILLQIVQMIAFIF